MAESSDKCSYRSNDSLLTFLPGCECPHPVLAGGAGLCTFHYPKKSNWPPQFNGEFKTLVSRLEADPNVKHCDFRGFQFPETEFLNLTFNKPVYFEDCIFTKNASFRQCDFHQKTVFASATFEGNSRFEACEFIGGTDFTEAKFNGTVRICDSKFQTAGSSPNLSCVTSFLNVSFGGIVSVHNCCFGGEVTDFSLAKFRALTIFYHTEFLHLVHFNSATIEKEVRFMGRSETSVVPVFYEQATFRRLQLQKDSVLSFESVDLSSASFLFTNIETVAFRNIEWLRGSGRRMLNDETSLSGNSREDDYENVADNYRQLVLNCEQRREFEAAEDFHVGEMEMRRRKLGVRAKHPRSRKLRECINGYSLYWLLSKYGTSYWWAFRALSVWLCCFSLVFLLAGFQESDHAGSSAKITQIIQYNIWPDDTHKFVSLLNGQWWTDFGKALLLALSALTFQKENFYTPANGLSRFCLCLAVIVFASQAALLLLAIRRRFRR